MFKIVDMVAYYKYLFLLSWPSFLAYLTIIIFFVYRFIFRIKSYRNGNKRITELLRICTTSILSVVIIYIFGIIFFPNMENGWKSQDISKVRLRKLTAVLMARFA
jgi:ABC-type dipeptide/oligopeptide/nickel transport system permease component